MSSQPSLFVDPGERRDRIVAAIAKKFPCYGDGGAASPKNPVAVTLAKQPPTFAWGVKVRDVVDAVIGLYEEAS